MSKSIEKCRNKAVTQNVLLFHVVGSRVGCNQILGVISLPDVAEKPEILDTQQ
jgi:hypothetical protein